MGSASSLNPSVRWSFDLARRLLGVIGGARLLAPDGSVRRGLVWSVGGQNRFDIGIVSLQVVA